METVLKSGVTMSDVVNAAGNAKSLLNVAGNASSIAGMLGADTGTADNVMKNTMSVLNLLTNSGTGNSGNDGGLFAGVSQNLSNSLSSSVAEKLGLKTKEEKKEEEPKEEEKKEPSLVDKAAEDAKKEAAAEMEKKAEELTQVEQWKRKLNESFTKELDGFAGYSQELKERILCCVANRDAKKLLSVIETNPGKNEILQKKEVHEKDKLTGKELKTTKKLNVHYYGIDKYESPLYKIFNNIVYERKISRKLSKDDAIKWLGKLCKKVKATPIRKKIKNKFLITKKLSTDSSTLSGGILSRFSAVTNLTTSINSITDSINNTTNFVTQSGNAMMALQGKIAGGDAMGSLGSAIDAVSTVGSVASAAMSLKAQGQSMMNAYGDLQGIADSVVGDAKALAQDAMNSAITAAKDAAANFAKLAAVKLLDSGTKAIGNYMEKRREKKKRDAFEAEKQAAQKGYEKAFSDGGKDKAFEWTNEWINSKAWTRGIPQSILQEKVLASDQGKATLEKYKAEEAAKAAKAEESSSVASTATDAANAATGKKTGVSKSTAAILGISPEAKASKEVLKNMSKDDKIKMCFEYWENQLETVMFEIKNEYQWKPYPKGLNYRINKEWKSAEQIAAEKKAEENRLKAEEEAAKELAKKQKKYAKMKKSKQDAFRAEYVKKYVDDQQWFERNIRKHSDEFTEEELEKYTRTAMWSFRNTYPKSLDKTE